MEVVHDLPTALVVGAERCATTWIHRCLRAVSGVVTAAQKPVGYWGLDPRPDLDHYARAFPGPPGSVRVDVTAGYSTLPPAVVDTVAQVLPRVRVVLMLREPRARAWSDARFRTLARLGRAPTEDELLDHIRSPACRARGDYHAIVRTWGRLPLLVVLVKHVLVDPVRVLVDVLDHVGAPRPPTFAGVPIRKRYSLGPYATRSPRVRDLLEDLYPRAWVEELSDLVRLDLVRRWRYDR